MKSRPEEERGFSVLVEQVEGYFKLLGEKVDLLNQKLDRTVKDLERRDNELDSKIGLSVRSILSKIDQHSGEIKKEMSVLASRIDIHERAHAS